MISNIIIYRIADMYIDSPAIGYRFIHDDIVIHDDIDLDADIVAAATASSTEYSTGFPIMLVCGHVAPFIARISIQYRSSLLGAVIHVLSVIVTMVCHLICGA